MQWKLTTGRRHRLLRGMYAGMALGALTAGATLRAQEDGGTPQDLTIWIVRPVTSADRAVQRAQRDLNDIKQYRESTAGNFGASASDTGQTAGSYGKPASEFGRPASEVGQTAGSYGQTSGSLPGKVTSQTAGSYGQTAGSFGTSASDFTGAPPAAGSVESTALRDSKGTRWTEFLSGLQNSLHMRVRALEVNGLDLRGKLTAAAGTVAFPDVLLSDRLPDWWPSAAPDLTVRRMADRLPIMFFPGESTAPHSGVAQHVFVYAAGLVQAPHPEATREFLEWWLTGARFRPVAGRQRDDPTPAEVLAREAVLTLLNGGSVDGMADPAMARFDPGLTRAALLTIDPSQIPADFHADAAVSGSYANDRFAAVQLHAVCLSRKLYGELFPLVLLRRNEQGRWRVLQITMGMGQQDAARADALLEPYATESPRLVIAGKPVPASPADAEQRAPGSGLRLAWDETSDDGLLLVEWQYGTSRTALASSILLVSDVQGRARTEVPAPFANLGGPVRWRVWALGHGGTVQLSDWRSVDMR